MILVDYARRHRAGKRGGIAENTMVGRQGLWEPGKGRDVEVVALDDARTALARSMPERRKYMVDRFGSLKAKSNRLSSRKGYCC